MVATLLMQLNSFKSIVQQLQVNINRYNFQRKMLKYLPLYEILNTYIRLFCL